MTAPDQPKPETEEMPGTPTNEGVSATDPAEGADDSADKQDGSPRG